MFEVPSQYVEQEVPLSVFDKSGLPSDSEVKDFCHRTETLDKWLLQTVGAEVSRGEKERLHTFTFWLFRGKDRELLGLADSLGVPKELGWLWLNGEGLDGVEQYKFMKKAAVQFHHMVGYCQVYSPDYKITVAGAVNIHMTKAIQEFVRPRLLARVWAEHQLGEFSPPEVPPAEDVLEEDDASDCSVAGGNADVAVVP